MQRRQLDLPDLDAAVAEARRLHNSGYDKAGQWDLGQVCKHCSLPMHECIDGPTFKPSVFLKLIVKLSGAKGKFFATRSIKPGLPAPAGFVFAPADAAGQAAAVEQLTEAASRFKQHTGSLHDHPLFGPLSRDQWHQFHTIHTAHHLGFLLPQT